MSRSKVTREKRAAIGERKYISKKRKRPLNPYEQAKLESADSEPQNISASASKIKDSDFSSVPIDESIGYVILNFVTVFSAISACVKCKTCGSNVTFSRASERGLGFKLVVNCGSCQPTNIPSCPYIGSTYEINRRFFFALRLLGLGLNGAVRFCGIMDLHRPVFQSTYDVLVQSILRATDIVRERILSASVEEEKQKAFEASNSDDGLTVSGDGSWKKRGFNSLHGVSTLIGHYTGKVLDLLVKSKFCKACDSWKSKLDTADYAEWFESHKDHCSSNHDGSAGKMEVDAIVEMFERSESKYGVKYINYIGDGDCRTYNGIANIYGPSITVQKKECVGHVQKRMGTRLRAVKKNSKGLGGRGKLTGKLIDELTVYYGLAIRRNSDSMIKMKNAVWATFYHKCSTDEKPRHEYCPEGPESWCTWQQAKAAGTLNEYQHTDLLHPDVIEAIRPVYESLSEENLLQRCVGGFTQNANESFNNTIWRLSPKSQNGGAAIINIAANISASVFNEGTISYTEIMHELGIKVGRNCITYCGNEDRERIDLAEIRASEATREGRITRRQRESSANDVLSKKEGTLYAPGIAD